MSAPLDPVNCDSKAEEIGGRYKPPSEKLTGPPAPADILGIDKRGLRRAGRQGDPKPAVVQPNGVRWFDIETVWRLAVERQKAGVRAPGLGRPGSLASPRASSASRVPKAPNHEWFAAGLSLGPEVVMRSGKTNETVRYLDAKTEHRVRMTAPGRRPTGRSNAAQYFPE